MNYVEQAATVLLSTLSVRLFLPLSLLFCDVSGVRVYQEVLLWVPLSILDTVVCCFDMNVHLYIWLLLVLLLMAYWGYE